jgi:hypothetical protein
MKYFIIVKIRGSVQADAFCSAYQIRAENLVFGVGFEGIREDGNYP